MAETEKAEHRQRHVITETFGEQPRESFVKHNAAALLAILVTLGLACGGAFIAWGNLKAENSSNQVAIVRLEIDIAKVNAKVDAHNNDSSIHMDAVKWELLNNKIDGIQELITHNHRMTQ